MRRFKARGGAVMTDSKDNTISAASSGFTRRGFRAGDAGTAVTPLVARGAGAAGYPPAQA